MAVRYFALAITLAGSMGFAMDMSRVNALAEQIRAGAAVGTVATFSVKKAAPSTQAAPAAEIQQYVSGASISEESLGLRKSDLYSEEGVTPPPVKYTSRAPGSGKKFERAYENAPPMIPHSVEGLLPITKNNNACLGCHMPDVAPSMEATPIPPSHFSNFRPMTQLGANGEVLKEGHAIENTSDIKMVVRKQDKLYQGRFNCTQCHAPQAEIEPAVKNSFTPDFRSPDGASKSNLLDTLNEGVE